MRETRLMTPNPNPIAADESLMHQFKNHLAVIVGFCDLLLDEIPPADQKHIDLQEMRKAAEAAMALLPRLQRTA
jgi:hypothetical protein